MPDPQTPPPTAPALDPARWVDDHGDALYRYAYLRLRDAELAEDAVQETFIAALRGAEGFRGGSSERTWLIGILKRKVIDHFRRGGRETPVSALAGSDEDDGGFAALFDRFGHWKSPLAAWEGNPRDRLRDKEFHDVLRHCLEALPGRQGEAFILREMEQMESAEVCQVLGVTPTNLWALLHRARVRLRNCLGRNWFANPLRRKGDGDADV